MSHDEIGSAAIKAVAQKLAAMDVVFYATHADSQGQKTALVDAAELPTFAEDPPAWWARHYGISRDDYLGWHAANYQVLCCALTSRGRLCRNGVRGGNFRDPAEWARMERQQLMCPVHEERGARAPGGG